MTWPLPLHRSLSGPQIARALRVRWGSTGYVVQYRRQSPACRRVRRFNAPCVLLQRGGPNFAPGNRANFWPARAFTRLSCEPLCRAVLCPESGLVSGPTSSPKIGFFVWAHFGGWRCVSADSPNVGLCRPPAPVGNAFLSCPDAARRCLSDVAGRLFGLMPTSGACCKTLWPESREFTCLPYGCGRRSCGPAGLMASASSVDFAFGDMYGKRGHDAFVAWRRRHEHDWWLYHCPLTGLHNPRSDDHVSKKEHLLPLAFKQLCHRALEEGTPEHVVPYMEKDLRTFNTACWFLGLDPVTGLRLRFRNYADSNLIWP